MRHLAASMVCWLLVACSPLDLGEGVRPCGEGEVRDSSGRCSRALTAIEVPGFDDVLPDGVDGSDYVLEVGPFADEVELDLQLVGGGALFVDAMEVPVDSAGGASALVATDHVIAIVVRGPTGDVATTHVSFTHRREPVSAFYVKAPLPGEGDAFGSALAIDGRFLAVGAPLEDGGFGFADPDPRDDSAIDAGAAYVFRFEGSRLLPEQFVKAPTPARGDRFGASVALDMATLVVGCPGCDGSLGPGAGAAFVFRRVGVTWSLDAELRSPAPGAHDEFGASVAIAGDVIVVGAPGEASASDDAADDSAPRAGAVYVFRRVGDVFVDDANLKASYPDAGDAFGASVAIDGSRIVVGAPGDDGNGTRLNGDPTNDSAMDSGAAFVFVRTESGWISDVYFKGDYAGASDTFGSSVAVVGDRVLVGAPGDDRFGVEALGTPAIDESRQNNGAASLFEYVGAAASHRATFDTDVPRASLELGTSVAMLGRWTIEGAPGDRSGAGGVDGPRDESGPWQAGAVYVHTIDADDTVVQHLLQTPALTPSSGYDRLGSAVAASAGVIAAGSPYEDGRSAGVDGDPSVRGVVSSGAVFVWR